MKRPRAPLARLTTPLVRDGSRAEGGAGLRPASWDEALDRAATLLRGSTSRHGPGTFGMFACSKATNEVNYLAQKLARAAIGSNHVDSCNRT